MEDLVTLATDQIVRRALDHKEGNEFHGKLTGALESENDRMPLEVLIVSRGLNHPEPWAVRYSTYQDLSTSNENHEMVRKLLMHPPDVFISPVVAVYCLKNVVDSQ